MATVDRSAPGVRIVLLADEHAVSGTPLDLGDRIIAFTFEDAERKADQVTLQLDNFDLALFDREDLAGGAILEVSWGYPGQMAPPRRVMVRKLKGFTALTLEGRAVSVLMDREVKTRAFEQQSRAEIARSIAQEYGYSGAWQDIEESAQVIEQINQVGETDARFLRRLANQEGREFYVDGAGFHFHTRRQSAAPTHVFTWHQDPGRGDILSIQVESDLGRRVGRVTVRSRDPMTRSTLEASANNQTAERETLAEVIEVVDPETGATAVEMRNATATLAPSVASTEAQLQQQAQARFRQAERSSVQLSLRIVGDPSVHAKSIVELRNISGLLSGKYYVTQVKHSLSAAGYFCDLKLVRDGSGQHARRLAQAQGGAHNQSVAGAAQAVVEVEVVDPESGATHIEYRQGDQPIGVEDPEREMSRSVR